MNVIISLVVVFFSLNAFSAVNLPKLATEEPVERLSQTGLFQPPVTNLQPSNELIAYDINQELFVDHASKKRFVYVPKGKKIDFHKTEAFQFPKGSALVKHFEMETSKGVFQKIETRVLIYTEDEKWVGFTYQWKDDDALLVKDRENPVVAITVDATAKGGERQQNFKIPSRSQCLSCHHSSVGFARSFRTFQLNKSLDGQNQIRSLADKGILEGVPDSLADLTKLASLDDSSASLESRAKAYLSVNCAHCHNPDPTAMCEYVGIDFRFNHFDTQKLIDDFQIVPGRSQQSSIHRRMARTGFGRMPMIGADYVHQKAIDVIGQWIDGLPQAK